MVQKTTNTLASKIKSDVANRIDTMFDFINEFQYFNDEWQLDEYGNLTAVFYRSDNLFTDIVMVSVSARERFDTLSPVTTSITYITHNGAKFCVDNLDISSKAINDFFKAYYEDKVGDMGIIRALDNMCKESGLVRW